ncbi:D-isomer specific 2-hydroxyacid dehydrogenase, NAD-binding [Alkaliphilus metalliredigens QYMF]|uniref:D-isomer specific 2-hydroxyacid dehydrogenase, NAD-binding n=1 Tax=Alkaliphilus metalliredigens (strain QYMF) TaxID=293826 RepID=A6TVU1_ALKMQ|nr:D-2-hydroxyacid dehydrogenase [Alkaliphilus metalliredigens]ABR50309.1 D-isomer specific 2-hydroxyacid dehydrogenase, NAD-binding [Alkaliphilus metalliredigens QYMF]
MMRKALIHLDFPAKHLVVLRERYPELQFVINKEKDGLLKQLEDTEVLITFQCTKEMVAGAPKLKWIQGVSAGIDAMPLEEITSREIILTNGKGIHGTHMAEYALAAMISLARNLHLVFRNQTKRKWERDILQGEIFGATVGILGLGSIGKEVAKKASLMGMKVIGLKNTPESMEYVDHVYGPEEMDEVFIESDYVINLLPHTQQTHGIINKRHFQLMKETACFINMGRGRTVNEEDLIEALQNDEIRALFTDVFEEEPLPEESPLWEMENVVITPHICGESYKYMDHAMEIIEHNLKVYLYKKGEMINLVDFNSGY